MIGPRWRKVIQDLWDNKVRNLLVVASIFIGVFNVGLTVAMYSLIGEDLNTSWSVTNPSQIIIYTSPFEPEFLDSLRRLPGIAEAEGSSSLQARLKIGPDEWIPISLATRSDFEESRVDLLKPVAGAWPPGNQQLVIERGSLKYSRAKIGDLLEIQLSDDTIRKIPLVGVVHDPQTGQGSMLGVNGYVAFDTLEWLHSDKTLTSIAIALSENPVDKNRVQEFGDRIGEYVRKSGLMVYYVYIPPLGQHPSYTQMMGVVAIIGALGFMSLFLAGFLIFNTFSAMMVQQVRYIGMMKAVGARRSHLVVMYLVLIIAFSLLALLPAIPLSAYVASGVAILMGQQFNYESLGFRSVPAAILVQVIVGVGMPLLAGILPVYTGTRITVHKALSNYGLGRGQFGHSLVDRLVENIRGLSRPLLISIRNTFRRKGRLILTLATLALGGAIFVAVYNFRDSMVVFIEQIGKYFLSDANVGLYQAYPLKEIEDCLMQIPGVKRVEGWTGANAELLRENGTGTDNVQIIAPPVDSDLLEPILLEGRWLTKGDENAIVLNNALWQAYPDLKVGDEIELKINERETTWRVVGFFLFFAVLVALVGAIGLMGTMSMNVMERTREIGVMRAIGATNAAIFRIVLVEGMLIGFSSWVLGALAAIPICKFLYDILSRALFQIEGKVVVTRDGFIIWLILAVFLSAIASLMPARSASRMTVRDVLAYE